jgi:proline iminopeptidase
LSLSENLPYRYQAHAPFLAEHVEVGATHRLWVERSGAPGGIPVVALHGGPGVPFEPRDGRLLDLDYYQLVQFDQRGCGRSAPHASVADNSIWHTVDDLERLRKRYGFERWIVTGHSYGTTIALAYAQAHPDRVSALVLRGLFLATKEEMDWIAHGWQATWPDAWTRAVAELGVEDPDDYYPRLAELLDDPDPEVRQRAAVAYSRYELNCCYAEPDADAIESLLDIDSCVANARIASHYAANHDFLEPGQLLGNIERIRHLPIYVVNGRFDVVTPPRSAWQLKTMLPELVLRIVPLTGHMSTEPGNIAAVTEIFDELKLVVHPAGSVSLQA